MYLDLYPCFIFEVSEVRGKKGNVAYLPNLVKSIYFCCEYVHWGRLEEWAVKTEGKWVK